MSLASALQECIYLEQLLGGIDKYKYAQTKVYEDNQGTIALARNPVSRQRCKHIDIKYHFIRETVNNKRVILEYCPTEQMIADVFTKPATKLKLKKFAQDMFGSAVCILFKPKRETLLLFCFQVTQCAKCEWGC